MSLEEGLDPLPEGVVELGGVRLFIDPDRGDKGLDDLPEVAADTVDAAGDGETSGEQRYLSRFIELNVRLRPVDGSGVSVPADHATLDEQLMALRTVLALLPDRSQTRLLRWRRRGQPAKRLQYIPGPGQPLSVSGDQAMQAFANATATIRVTAPDPIVRSDELHDHTFEAGETFTLNHAGSQTMVQPTNWRLTAPGPVAIEHLDYPGEYLRFPAGPVTVSEDYDIETDDSAGIVYGRASSWHPQWVLLRPGANRIKASAPCTLYWRDAF